MITIKLTNFKYNVLHTDHGISKTQLEFILKSIDRSIITKRFMPDDEVFISQETMDDIAHGPYGTVPCGLYGPAMGDDPVTDDQVSLEKRGDREWTDRIIDRPTRDVDYVQVIGIKNGYTITVFTVYGGPLAPQNPEDPSCEDVDASTKFWSEHALV